MTINSNIRVPGSYNEIDESGANNRLPAYRQPICIIAPRIATPAGWVTLHEYSLGDKVAPVTPNGYYYICVVAGTSGASEPAWPAAGGTVVDGYTCTWREYVDASEIVAVHTPVKCYSADDGARYAGAGSIAHRMVRAAFMQYRYAEVTLITVDDDIEQGGTGVYSTATVTFSGTATGSGRLECRIGNDLARTAWSDGATAVGVAWNLDAVLAALHDLPVTPRAAEGASDTGIVTLVNKNAGVPGSETGKYNTTATKHLPAITIYGDGITAAITGFISGGTNPDITDALTAATAGEYALIACPFRDTDNLDALEAHLAAVSDENNCSGARAFVGITSSIALATTAAARNNERMHVGFVRKCRFPSYEIAAAFAAMHAQTGHPALPLNTMEMVNCDAPDETDRLEFNETNALLYVGVTPFNADSTGAVRCIRSITTYLTNAAGSLDDTYLDTTVVACLDYLRKSIKSAHELNFTRCVLRENHVDGEPDFVVTPDDIRSFNIAKCKQLEQYGVCQQVDVLKPQFVSARDAAVAGRVNSDIPVEVVQGLHILANTIRLTTTV
jgi:phage tail sheath gpL-like